VIDFEDDEYRWEGSFKLKGYRGKSRFWFKTGPVEHADLLGAISPECVALIQDFQTNSIQYVQESQKAIFEHFHLERNDYYTALEESQFNNLISLSFDEFAKLFGTPQVAIEHGDDDLTLLVLLPTPIDPSGSGVLFENGILQQTDIAESYGWHVSY
jgi:hypothetical protein